MKKLLIAAAFGVMLAGAAQAQDRPGMFPDPNGDGVTTKAESTAAADARFARLDTDKDGKLSAAERASAPGGGRGLDRADTDGDGTVSLEEVRASAAMRFDRIDANKDGKIDKAEADAVMARMGQMRGN
ncbi:MAG: EF-hand domain-containing protein [Sphingomonadales bacterium]|nr:MAG: EF-hand domain-containing protein [Sphingomonadales bacterium]